MKKIRHHCILFAALIISTGGHTSALNVNAQNLTPTQIIKDINQLYMSLIVDDLSKPSQINIICNQIPSKISDYKKVDPNDKTKTAGLFTTLQENIEQTRKSLQISCQKS